MRCIGIGSFPLKPFGFSPNAAINLNTVGIGVTGSLLSWQLDNLSGGYRAGDDTGLNGDNNFQKVILNCTGNENHSCKLAAY